MCITKRFVWLAAILFFLVLVQPGIADNYAVLSGIWKLVSYEIEIQATGQRESVMGKYPTGYVVFTPEGRAFFILTGEGRKPATTTQQRADLLSSLVAYTGLYRIENDQWITSIDVGWNPEWVGTEQKRFFKVEGERLQVLTSWRIMPNWADKGMQRSIITFERVK